MQICPKCNGNKIDQGWVWAEADVHTGMVYYRSDNRKLLKKNDYLRAHVCLTCGHMEFMLDVNKLKKNLKKK
jgi:hypothetical protein